MTRLVLEQRRRLCDQLAGRGIDAAHLVVADDENLEISAEFGGLSFQAANKPLGAKCNAGLKYAAALGFDFLVWVGSDDWIHPDVFQPLLSPDLGDGAIIISGRRFAIVDLATGTLQRIETPSRYGAIPWIIDTRLFKGRPVEPIQPHLSRGLDGALVRGLRLSRVGFSWAFHTPNDFRCVDFKSTQNLTPFSGLAKHIGFGDPEPAWTTLADWFPEDLVAKARALSEEDY